MQSYTDLAETSTLQASRSVINNNIKTALSLSSGASFPTANLQVGMACWRTDQSKLYVLKSDTPIAWELIYSASSDGVGSGLDADLLDGQDGSYYTAVAARLGYTPVNKAGDSMSGDLNFGTAFSQVKTPNYRYLDISGTVGGAIRLGDGNTHRAIVFSSASGMTMGTEYAGSEVVFITGSTPRMVIGSDGTVKCKYNLVVEGGVDDADLLMTSVSSVCDIRAVNPTNTQWRLLRVQEGGQTVFGGGAPAADARITVNGRIYGQNGQGGPSWMVGSFNASVGGIARGNGYIEFGTDLGAVGCTYFLSDIRKKENIAPSTKNAAELIDQIEFIEFDWKEGSGNEGHVECGVSAQQLQSIHPRLVNELSDGMLMVNEPALVAFLAKAMQEQQTRIAGLEARIVALESAR